MNLSKYDLNQIGTIVDKRVGQSERKLEKKIEDEIGGLATMTKRGFDEVGEKFKQQDKKIDQALVGISHLEFIATEMVRRDELLAVKQRLTKIEAKLGITR